jgi:hypothetical protein
MRLSTCSLANLTAGVTRIWSIALRVIRVMH